MDEEEDAITVVWGTTVTIQSSMTSFRWFLDSFRARDRQEYDNARYEALLAEGADTSTVQWAYAKDDPDKKVYEGFLGRMWETGQTNLNLDVLDLLAFRASAPVPLSKKDRQYAQLYNNLQNYPQEIIPILDQVLKDAALDFAWAPEQQQSQEGRRRAEDMEGAVFKVRPFGGERSVNMRELNPQGEHSEVSAFD